MGADPADVGHLFYRPHRMSAGSFARVHAMLNSFFGVISRAFLSVIAPREIFFQPNIEADEEVARAHLVDFEFGDSGPAVAPGDGDGGEAVSPHDRLQWELDGDIKMG